VLLSTGVGVREARFTVLYDPALLTIDAVALGPAVAAEATLVFDMPTPGTLHVSVTNASADLSASAGKLALVSIMREDTSNPGQFLSPLVPLTAAYGGRHALDLSDIRLFGPGDAPIAAIADDGLHIAGYPGDLSGNQVYNAPDASFSQQMVLSAATFGLAAYPLVDPHILADINANGSIQANDTSQIQRLILNLSVPFVPPRPAVNPAPLADPATMQVTPSRFPTDSPGDKLVQDRETDLVADRAVEALAGEDLWHLESLWPALAAHAADRAFDELDGGLGSADELSVGALHNDAEVGAVLGFGGAEHLGY
jgi:hypothetical protein